MLLGKTTPHQIFEPLHAQFEVGKVGRLCPTRQQRKRQFEPVELGLIQGRLDLGVIQPLATQVEADPERTIARCV